MADAPPVFLPPERVLVTGGPGLPVSHDARAFDRARTPSPSWPVMTVLVSGIGYAVADGDQTDRLLAIVREGVKGEVSAQYPPYSP